MSLASIGSSCCLPITTRLTASDIASAMAGVGIVAKIAHDSVTPPASIIPLGDVAFALPLGANFLLTALIAGRIWHIAYRGEQMHKGKRFRAIQVALEVIVESGAMILAIQLIFVVLWGIQSNAQNIAVSSALQIYVCVSLIVYSGSLILNDCPTPQGIAPTLIIVRVGMGVSIEETMVEKSTSNFSSQAPALVSFGSRTQRTGNTDVEMADYEAGKLEGRSTKGVPL
jgi:hypothetical protein